jgi:hypothetical protein
MDDLRIAATAQRLLEGIPLPVRKEIVLDYARRVEAPAEVLAALERIPDRQYRRLDDIGEAIEPVQPAFAPPGVRLPREESDAPPGGSAYLDAGEDSGWIRDEKETLSYEEQLVRTVEKSGLGSAYPRGRPDKGLEPTEGQERRLEPDAP